MDERPEADLLVGPPKEPVGPGRTPRRCRADEVAVTLTLAIEPLPSTSAALPCRRSRHRSEIDAPARCRYPARRLSTIAPSELRRRCEGGEFPLIVKVLMASPDNAAAAAPVGRHRR